MLSSLLGNTTKGTIIKVLSENQKLSTKEIYNQVKRNTKKEITYQATHKAIKEMEKEGILKKTDTGIEINDDWIDTIYTISSKLKNNRENNIQPNQSQTKTYTFDNFVDAGKALIKFGLETPHNNKTSVTLFHHAWPFVGMSKIDYERLQEIGKLPFYDIIVNDTKLDKLFANILSGVGKKVKVGIDIGIPFDFLIKGNITLQIHFTKEFTKEYYSIFKKYQKLESLEIGDLFQKVMFLKTKITFIEIEDTELAERLRQKILKEFTKI